mgnify:CR=1 FL=1
MKKIISAVALCLCFAATANAQEDKLVVKPSGRILLDGALMQSSNDKADEQTESGFNVPDIRIGMMEGESRYWLWSFSALGKGCFSGI